MGLKADAIKMSVEKERARATRRCLAVRLADDLPAGEDRDYYWTLMAADPKEFSAQDIADLLAKSGIIVSPSTLAAHRSERKRCGCTPAPAADDRAAS